MNPTDFAIVIGIRRYPTLGVPHPPGSPRDLQGPDRDAQDIYNWLVAPAPAGGGVPVANTLLVTSSLYPDPFPQVTVGGRTRLMAQPDAEAIAGCFGWLKGLFDAGRARFLGRRLYVYFSGHGFGISDANGGVYTADANPTMPHHFYVQDWFNWFYRNAVFQEFVLWMDACSDPIPISQPHGTLFPPGQAPSADCLRFVAYAARHPLKSVERAMPNGAVGGVFTYTLLTGLRGAATDPQTNRVTGYSLRNYLERNLRGFQPEQDHLDPDIGSDPAFGTVDDLDFCAGALITFPGVITFDATYSGQAASISDGTLAQIAQTVVNGAPWAVNLPVGIYKVKVAQTSMVFEVNGDSAYAIHLP